jgi:cardiolipin synthase
MITSSMVHMLTLSRLCLAPFAAHAIMVGQDTRAFVLVVCAFATDILDGWMARTFKQESRFGKLADPVADKIFVLFVLYALHKRLSIPWVLFYCFLARDVILAVGAIVLWRKFGQTLRPSIWGKLAMGLSISSFLLWFGRSFVSNSVDVYTWSHVCWGVFLCALCASCASFYDYGLSFWEKVASPLGGDRQAKLARAQYVGTRVWTIILGIVVLTLAVGKVPFVVLQG